MIEDDYISMVVHGESKAGKTTFSTTGPGRTLVLDAEAGGMRFVPGKKIMWDVNAGEAPPESGDWKICRVPVTGIRTLNSVRDWLRATPAHPFNNIVLDSLTEMQDMVKRDRSSTFQLEQADWGVVFGVMNDAVVSLRDVTSEQSQVKSLTIITGTQFRNGLSRPMISGQFAGKLAYKVDAIAYLHKMKDESGQTRRVLILGESAVYEVGHRLGDNAPEVLWDPTVTKLLNHVFGSDYTDTEK